MAWLRLECGAAWIGWTAKLPNDLYGAWCKVLQTVKLHGWGGSIALNDAQDALRLAQVDDRALARLLEASEGHIVVTDDRLSILNWHRYQDDPSNAVRQARHREKVTVRTVSNESNADGTGQDIHITPLPPASGGVTATVAPATKKATSLYSAEFERFWAAYPRQVGKGAAWRAWGQIKQRPAVDVMIAAINQQRTLPLWTRDNGQYIRHPSTWLNGRHWEDSLTVTPSGPRPASKLSLAVDAQVAARQAWDKLPQDERERRVQPIRAKYPAAPPGSHIASAIEQLRNELFPKEKT